MTLQQLRYAVTIADMKSMNKAASELFVSQPALSNTIHDLEEELQMPAKPVASNDCWYDAADQRMGAIGSAVVNTQTDFLRKFAPYALLPELHLA